MEFVIIYSVVPNLFKFLLLNIKEDTLKNGNQTAAGPHWLSKYKKNGWTISLIQDVLEYTDRLFG